MDTWPRAEGALRSAVDLVDIERTLVAVMIQKCDLPSMLRDVYVINAEGDTWWSILLNALQSHG